MLMAPSLAVGSSMIEMSEALSAKVIEWDAARGFGYLSAESGRLFLHIKDIEPRPRLVRVGDRVRYQLGADPKGRPRAVRAQMLTCRSNLGVRHLVVLLLLLLLPGLALVKLPVESWIKATVAIVLSFITFASYASDKRRAQAGAWRISEFRLHLFSLLGGWPGAFLAQKSFRHKTVKKSFQFTFWLTVLLYQFAAFDYLADGKFTRQFREAAAPVISQISAHISSEFRGR